MTSEKSPADDPKARLLSLREDREALKQGADPSIPAPDLPDEFLVRLVEAGSCYAGLPRKFLARCGVDLKPPEDLGDDELREALWELIWVLALLRMFLEHTDGFTDRQLYTYLYGEALLEPAAFMPGEENPPFYTLDPTENLEVPPAPVCDRDRRLP